MKDEKDKKEHKQDKEFEITDEAEQKEGDEHEEQEGSLENRISELESEVEQLKDQLARSVADYRNFEKRKEEEKHEFVKFANRDLLIRLLPAFDTLFLAGKYVEDEGLKLTIKRLLDVFSEIGVEKIKTEGEEFDPILMECVETKDGEEGKVLQEIKPGFTLYGKLLTPATVIVGKKMDETNKKV